VLVIAILHFVFGGLGLTCGICGGIAQVAGGNQMFQQPGQKDAKAADMEKFQKDLEKHVEEKLPANKAVTYAELGLGIVANLLMVISGVGLLMVKSWGRILSIVYGVFSILLNIGAAAYAFLLQIPVTAEFFKNMPGKGQEQEAIRNMMQFALYGAAAFQLLFLIYPIIVLIIMFRPKVVAAFAGGEASDRAGGEDEHIEEDERWGR
jgi:hypothetical protein